jgi:tRNA-modifying protein YgfZ
MEHPPEGVFLKLFWGFTHFGTRKSQLAEQDVALDALSSMVVHQIVAEREYPRMPLRDATTGALPASELETALERTAMRAFATGEVMTMNSASFSSGYGALREHAAWLDLSASDATSRGKIRVTGEDRKRLLHAMTTNQVQQLEPGSGNYVFFLNAQGRILADANLFVLEDSVLLDTEPETRHKLREHLDRYIIADDVTLEDVTHSLATVSIEGPEAEDFLKQHAAPVPSKAYETALWGDRIVARASTTGQPGFLIFLPHDEKEDLLAQFSLAGMVEADEADQRTVRIELGHPRYGEEITERYLVQETGQLQAVSFEKGCYLGQEIVERVRSRAQIHRILRPFELATKDIPEAGSKFQAGEEDAGEVVTAAYSPVLDKVVGLAYIRMRFAEPGTALSLAGAPALVRKA